MKRVTGIGGIFFKSEDPEKLYQWYENHLGIERDSAARPRPLSGVSSMTPRRRA